MIEAKEHRMTTKDVVTVVKIDGEGRTRLPPAAREALGLKKGARGTLFEIAVARWPKHDTSTEDRE